MVHNSADYCPSETLWISLDLGFQLHGLNHLGRFSSVSNNNDISL